MIDLSYMQDRRIAVMGLGLSGMVAAEALAASAVDVVAWDDTSERCKTAEARGIPVAPLLDQDWSRIDSLILSPGIPHSYPTPNPVAQAACDAGVEIVGDVELLVRAQSEARYVGITGTNGKSTTTALVAHILTQSGMHVAVGGNLGQPALSLEALDETGIYVLEMSSYQLELTPSVDFEVAVLLNLSPDHLDRHGGMDGYIAAKYRIFEQQDLDGIAVVGIDDSESRGLFDKLTASRTGKVVPISSSRQVENGVYASGPILIDTTGETPQQIRSLEGIETLPGAHNAQNAAAAYLVCRSVGAPHDDIVSAMETYPGLPHRQQLAAVIDGVRYVNDSKATNPEAAAKALSSYNEIYWIAGGRAKEGPLDVIHPFLPHVKRAYLIGESADHLAGQLADRIDVELCGDLAKATARAAEDAAGHDAVILLSPACASFDQFASFEERGRAFCRIAAAQPGTQRDVRHNGEAA